MLLRLLAIAVGLSGTVYSIPSADAATRGWATRAVNMRICPSVRCARILTIPAGARVRVYYCRRWCEVRFAGRHGFAYSRYIAIGGYRELPPPTSWWRPPFYRWDPPRYRWRPGPPYIRPPRPTPPGVAPGPLPPPGLGQLPPPGHIPGPPPPPPQPGLLPPIFGR